MALRMLAKDLSSGKHGCPSVYVEDATAVQYVLVVQGDLIEERAGDPPLDVRSVARVEDDGTVTVQGPRVPAAVADQMANVLTGEVGVWATPEALFAAELGAVFRELAPGEARVGIKADVVTAAATRYHEDP